MINVICTTLLVEKSPQALPLGAACIASAIKTNPKTKDNFNAELLSFSLEDKEIISAKNKTKTAEYIYKQILEKSPKIVCFSVFVWNRDIFEETSRLLQSKKIITIAGGPEVTAHPQSLQPNFNYVITGEGEIKIPELISHLKNSENIQNLDTTINNSFSTPKLEELTSPYLDGTIDPKEYGGALWELARGCPFKCSYCYESKGENRVRQFPMERIEKELDLFAKKKVPQVFVLDPTYNANKDRALKLLNLIAKKTPETFYYFEARAEFIDRQLAKAFTKIPCALQIGLQSAKEEVLKLVHRPFNRKQFSKNLNILNQEGVTFGLDLIYGLPGESLKSFKEGIDFAISLYPNNLEIFCLSVLPGTDLYDRATELKLTFQQNPPYHIIHTDRFSEQDIDCASKLAKACSFFYNEGRAVPWFNTICNTLHLKPSVFFNRFFDYAQNNKINLLNCNHKEIEKIQIQFITVLFTEKHLERYLRAATDIIKFNGAVSRKTDTGKSEELILNYPAEFIDSEYALNLEFFVNNVKIKKDRIWI